MVEVAERKDVEHGIETLNPRHDFGQRDGARRGEFSQEENIAEVRAVPLLRLSVSTAGT